MTIPQPPPGQGPVDPRGAFSPPPPPTGGPYQQQVPPPPGYPPVGGYGAPPPPMMMMPPPFYPPPPPTRGGGFARAMFTTLALSIFGGSIALNLYLLIASGLFSNEEALHQTVLVPGDPNQTIAVVQLVGMLDDRVSMRFDSILRQLQKESNIKALVLEVDTPGGTVSASDEIYQRIRKFKEDKRIPIVVSMGGFATSGGYYVSCAADKILAERTTITGNIGVLFPRYNLSKLAEKYGVEDATLHSTGSDFKDAGSMLRPESEEERKYWIGLIDDAYVTFKSVVQTGRGTNLKAPMTEVANGKAYTANEALKMGLIDQLGYAPDAYDVARSLASLSNKHVVRYQPIVSFFSALAGEGSFRGIGASSQNMTINGVNLNIDRHVIDELTTPRLMYLWRGQ